MVRRATIIKHILREELEEKYRKESKSRVKERLLAILHLYDGKSIVETSKIVKRGERSVKRWLRAWNKSGYDGLIPKFNGGPRPKLPESEWEKILKEGKAMTLKEVKVYVKNTRGIDYSYKAVWHVLRKKMKVSYCKPFVKNKKKDAEEVLKEGSMRLSLQ
ncbi:MAG: helix-turn-helix domain-containing protein [Nitrososphaerales archaeon]